MDLVQGSLTGAWTIGPPCLVFVACAYFTRAPVARVLAALVSGAAVTGFNIAADVLAHQRCTDRAAAATATNNLVTTSMSHRHRENRRAGVNTGSFRIAFRG
jgi:hypothetical protein